MGVVSSCEICGNLTHSNRNTNVTTTKKNYSIQNSQGQERQEKGRNSHRMEETKTGGD